MQYNNRTPQLFDSLASCVCPSRSVSISAILPVFYRLADTFGMIFNPLLIPVTDSAYSCFSALNPSQSLQQELLTRTLSRSLEHSALIAWPGASVVDILATRLPNSRKLAMVRLLATAS